MKVKVLGLTFEKESKKRETGPVRVPSEGSTGNDTVNNNENKLSLSADWNAREKVAPQWTHLERSSVGCVEFH